MSCPLHRALLALESIAHSLRRIADAGLGSEVVGIVVSPATPTQEREEMPNATFVKKASGAKATKAPAAAKAAGDVVDFLIEQDGSSLCTVYGVDAHGNRLDISALAKLTPPPTSSDPATITVDPPSGMTFSLKAVKLSTPGTPVLVTATATFDAGTPGPFTFTLPCDVIAGGPHGIEIVPGPVTVT